MGIKRSELRDDKVIKDSWRPHHTEEEEACLEGTED